MVGEGMGVGRFRAFQRKGAAQAGNIVSSLGSTRKNSYHHSFCTADLHTTTNGERAACLQFQEHNKPFRLFLLVFGFT